VEILMLSMHSEETLVRQALDAGARGYVLKNAMDLDLISAVKTVALGKPVLDPQVSKPSSLKGERGSGLTARELEVVNLITEGCTNKDIAKSFGISEETVKRHLTNIFNKLGVGNRLELALFALNHSLLPLGENK